MKKGIILKIVSEYSYVLFQEQIYECKAQGKIRHKNQAPATGDYVNFEIIDEKNFKGSIVSIEERQNELYRPRIVNIDQVVIITSVKEPDLNTFTLNKYLAFVEYLKLKPLLAFTKVDLLTAKDKTIEIVKQYEKVGYEIFLINNMIETDKEWMKFIKKLQTGVSVFTGQTGAGKSTTLNHIIPTAFERTQEISKALNRGKHTTTKNELFRYENGLIGDTPGFSSFELKDIDKNQLAHSFKFFESKINECKFNNCVHTPESKGCAILLAVETKEFPQFIYDDYLKMLHELEDQERRKKY
ncbi:ribosome small subunit-dependent GTPase A [Spiroplasma culicicola]|uniref:Small ribosomal subunit biogenesis GTPase RsgA n=1 Tax=Spiroplasma culicicola AES-1 TaxID=1276246 RepID=W6A7V5_9MOLU|nr:ribosome small subunit-dependent GTPase A [Spiroplasma culicicola]AHI53193.1 ribosome biogenesis GTPase [Spiroplasma culicicola AES-1]